MFANHQEEQLNRNRLKKTIYKLYTINTLLACRGFFESYIAKYGTEEPMQTKYPELNKIVNSILRYTHFVPTNQSYAYQVYQIITKASSDYNGEGLDDPMIILNALKEIKNIQEIMKKLHYTTGRVYENILITLHNFRLDETQYEVNVAMFEEIFKTTSKSEITKRYPYSPTPSSHNRKRL